MKNIVKILFFSVFFSALFTSCVEDDGWDELDGEGPSLIKFLEGPEKANYFSPFTNVINVNAFTLRRDASNNGELQKTTTIKLLSDPSIIDNYNEEHGDTYEQLPEDLYSLLSPAFKKTSTGYDVTLEGGDFSEEFTIAIDGSKWVDVSRKFALAFRVQDAPGLVGKSGQDSVMVKFAIKNRWDGVYEVTKGTMTDLTNATLTHYNDYLSSINGGNSIFELQTISATEVLMYHPRAGGDTYPINSGGAPSRWGSFGLILKFDPETNKIVEVTNVYGQPAGNTRSAQLDPSGINAYDPAAKTINFKWFMIQPSVVTSAPHIRVMGSEEMTYLRERE